jgi:hypothetical protein
MNKTGKAGETLLAGTLGSGACVSQHGTAAWMALAGSVDLRDAE